MVDKPDIQDKLTNALTQQIELQKHLIDAQNEIISLRKRIDELTPKSPETDVHWNAVSGGLTSEEVLNDGDSEKLRQFQDWIFSFGDKYVKPYVHQKTYAEIIAHMTRGLARRMAEADVQTEFGDVLPAGKTVQFPEKDTPPKKKKKNSKSPKSE